MERSDGIEGGTGGSASGVEPSFYIVGAPDTGKREIAQALVEKYPSKLTLKVENLETPPYALGSVCDYRVECKQALERSLERPSTPTLYTHSVLDSLAYLTFALSRYQMGTVSEDTIQRTITAWTLVGLSVRDSFRYGHVFLLQKTFDDVEEYESSELQTILQMILDEYMINYSIIDVEDDPVGKIADTLADYF